MILTHGANSLKRSGDTNITIDGQVYRTKEMPDGNIWTIDNLDFVDENMSYNVEGDTGERPACLYYDLDTDYSLRGSKKCGLLYNGPAILYLMANLGNVIDDWHIPTYVEFYNLLTSIGAMNSVANSLKAVDDSVYNGFPSQWNGLDTYGFNVLPCGRAIRNPGRSCSFENLGNGGYFRTQRVGNFNTGAYFFKQSNAVERTSSFNYVYYTSVRLIKNK